MDLLELKEIEFVKDHLQEIVKPYQQKLNRHQKKSDFLVKCIRCIQNNNFFQLDELLRSRQANEVLEDPNFKLCESIFNQLRKFTNMQIDNYRLKFKSTMIQLANEANLPLQVDFPRFYVLKGIEGKLDFSTRSTVVNQITIKSMDPKRIILTAVKLKRNLYDKPFDPQIFIDSLFLCYKNILEKKGYGTCDVVPIHQLYIDYVWSLQSKAFFQNMAKGKFKGYSITQFAVDLWRFFESNVNATEGGYRIRLNSGRGKSFWLIDQDGEKRQITHVLFVKN